MARIVDPEEKTIEIPIEQSGAGQYQASTDVSIPGTYLVRLGVNNKDQSLGQLTLGFVVPYSPEYRLNGVDRGLLEKLAQITGGSELVDLKGVFAHNLPVSHTAREIWQPVLFLVAILFPFDVAVRRLNLRKQDLSNAHYWLKERLFKGNKPISEQTPMLGQLFKARERTRQSRKSVEEDYPLKNKIPNPGEFQSTEEDSHVDTSESFITPPPEEVDDHVDSLDRLREAKKRAKRKTGN